MSTDRPAILPSEAAEYVLPAPPRAAGEVVVVAPRPDLASSLRRSGEVARTLGERFVSLAEGQQSFLAELRDRLVALDGSVAEASRAQWKGAVDDALSVLDWCDEVQADLLQQSRLAAGGAQPIGVVSLCEEVAGQVATDGQPVLVTGCCANPWWGSAAALAELVRCGLLLLAERAQGIGARCIDVSAAEGAVRLVLKSTAEPGDGIDGDSIRRFRQAVAAVGASVRPDGMGPGGASMVIEVPALAS
jgi:hypothetical protein